MQCEPHKNPEPSNQNDSAENNSVRKSSIIMRNQSASNRRTHWNSSFKAVANVVIVNGVLSENDSFFYFEKLGLGLLNCKLLMAFFPIFVFLSRKVKVLPESPKWDQIRAHILDRLG